MATVNIYDMADTWNNGATTFTAIKMNVTDTASASGSQFLDFQIASSSVWGVHKNGYIVQGNVSPYYWIYMDGGRYIHSSASNVVNISAIFGVDSNQGAAYITTFYGIGTSNAAASADVRLYRNAAGIASLRGAGTTTPGAMNLYTYGASPPTAPSASMALLYADTSGAKIRIMALFPSGAAQQIAIEP